MLRLIAWFCLALQLSLISVQAQTREEKVHADREKVLREAFWIYNDLQAGFAEARKTGKPLLVVLRCIPCIECVKLDDELVDRDPTIRPLLEKFVCVRIVSTNGLDLSTFQYDTDQSFAVFLLNADGTIYGRFGTRSHRTEWYDDVSLEGLARALARGLEWHARYPAIRDRLAGKTGQPLEFASPEKYPTLRDKYADSVDFSRNVVKACIHCHQIGDARREHYRLQNEAIPERLFFPYPHPKNLGLVLDPKQCATVEEVRADSVAARAGFRPGDEILSLARQPLLSIADVQWVLDGFDPRGGKLPVVIRRDGIEQSLTVSLPAGWRQGGDLNWRASTWGLRRMFLGGMKLEPLSEEQRRERNLPGHGIALRIEHLGQYGPHAVAKQAGFAANDILIAFDGRTDLTTEAEILWHANNALRTGDKVTITYLRNGKIETRKLPIQN